MLIQSRLFFFNLLFYFWYSWRGGVFGFGYKAKMLPFAGLMNEKPRREKIRPGRLLLAREA